MIFCSEAEEFVPFGREYLKLHPGDVSLPPPVPIGGPPLDPLDDSCFLESSNEWWTIRKKDECNIEEELYFKDKTVVWSQGQMGREGAKRVIKCMTLDTDVMQACFTTFYTYPDLPMLVGDPYVNEPTGKKLLSICILEKDCLSIYLETGEDYSVGLPFPVRSMWPIRYGLLLERKVSSEELKKPSEESLPVMYSLLHPLDEISPFLHRAENGNSSTMSYMNDARQEVIEVIPEASCSVLYDAKGSSIKLCKVRRASPEETLVFLQSGMPGSLAVSPLGYLSLSQLKTPNASVDISNSACVSSLQSKPSKLSVTQQSHVSLLGRMQSPSFVSSHCLRRGMSPLVRTNPGISRSLTQSVLDEAVMDPEPLVPTLSLDYLWTDRVENRPAKINLVTDCMERKYLCILVPPCNLRCFSFKFIDNESHAIIGQECTIEAKDMVVLDHLKLTVLIEADNSLSLYTGVTPVCKLYLTGPSAFNSTLFKDFSSLNISKIDNTPVRRSTLLPTVQTLAKFEVALSPVVKDRVLDDKLIEDGSLPLSLLVTSIRDATDVKFTIQHAGNSYYRISLPGYYCSDLVEKCIGALKYVLPQDIAISVLNSWYAKRNRPGNENFSTATEWNLFSQTLLSLMGYDVDKLSSSGGLDYSNNSTRDGITKKFRATDCGSENDWEYLLSSSYHQSLGLTWSEVLDLGPLETVQDLKVLSPGSIDNSALLFTHVPSVLFGLHLVYEEFKSSTTTWSLCPMMIPCLTQLAADLRAKPYLDHYWRDFPCSTATSGPPTQMSYEDLMKVSKPSYFPKNPPSLLEFLYNIMDRKCKSPYPYIPDICKTTRALILLYATSISDSTLQSVGYRNYLWNFRQASQKEESEITSIKDGRKTVYEKVVEVTTALQLDEFEIKMLGPGVSVLLMNAQHMCRSNPPPYWPVSAYNLVQRPDIVIQRKIAAQHVEEIQHPSLKKCMGKHFFVIKARSRPPADDCIYSKPQSDCVEDDGMESMDWDLLNAIWPDDQRIHDVRKMFVSSKTILVTIVQRAEVPDHDFIEEQEKHLFSMCARTMALPVSRGMFTLCTYKPNITEPLHIPPLVLKGKAPQRGNTIEFPNSEMSSDLDMWPNFHNGVAGGLRIAPNCGGITSTWIVYNRSKVENPYTHAGFLLALGLTGHLRNFSTVSLHDYLSAGHDFTCAGLLLGISAAMRGSMDMQTTKVLSVHIECLLPPTSTELDVSHTVQVAAIFGLGLLYAETGHRHMAEVLLKEIGRPAGPEMENSVDRESYSLAAALGLGFIMFGKGEEMSNLSELDLEGELHHYIIGGKRKPLVGTMKEKYKSPSYQIKEGDQVNIDVTAPGATLALGMTFFRSGNKAIANWLEVPATPYMLDQVRPDLLMLRTIAKGLVLWDTVLPTFAWVEGHAPSALLENVHVGGDKCKEGVDYETIHQAYYNTLAGACFVLGLRFAGSANEQAYMVLLKYAHMFTSFTKRSISEIAGKSTIEACLNVTLISLSMVMAGTGDLQVLRLIRFLRSRVSIYHASVGYGSHMATHMALGFLFLGGGRFTLGTSNMAIAALIVSCFPQFPAHSNDNRYHLQALRHFYVLACEPRLLIPINVDTEKFSKAEVRIKFADTSYYKNISYTSQAPLLLPELSQLEEVFLEFNENARHWPVRFTKGTESWQVLEALLANGGGVPLKLRYGRFAYDEMPCETKSSAPHYVSREKFSQWTLKPSVLEEALKAPPPLMKALLGSSSNDDDSNPLSQMLAILILEYMNIGKPEIIDNWVNLLQGISRVPTLNQYTSFIIWQIKLLNAISSHLYHMENCFDNPEAMDADQVVPIPAAQPLVTREQSLSLLKKLHIVIDEWNDECKEEIHRYNRGVDAKKEKSKKPTSFSPKCAYSLTMNDMHVGESETTTSHHPIDILKNLIEKNNESSVLSVTKDILTNINRKRSRSRKSQ